MPRVSITVDCPEDSPALQRIMTPRINKVAADALAFLDQAVNGLERVTVQSTVTSGSQEIYEIACDRGEAAGATVTIQGHPFEEGEGKDFLRGEDSTATANNLVAAILGEAGLRGIVLGAEADTGVITLWGEEGANLILTTDTVAAFAITDESTEPPVTSLSRSQTLRS